jgi:hypothetical protein
MILDILTVLFFVLGFALILWMVGERRRDVLHGPYVTKLRMARGNSHAGRLEAANAVDQLSRIVRDIEGESEMSTARLQELEKMAAKLLATARKLPPGPDRHNILQEIGRFRAQIAALQGADLRPAQPGLKAKAK